MVIKNSKVYDILKYIAQIFLPALGVFYVALSKYWPVPYPAEIAGTIAAVDALLGALLKISTNNYEGDGSLVINESDPEKDVYTLQLDIPIEEIANKKSVTFMVTKAEGSAE